MAKKFILLVFSILVLASCDMAMDSLDVTNGTKYIVTSKKKRTIDRYNIHYHLIKEGDRFFDYHYTDTTDFNIGDTLVITVSRVSN